MKAIVIVGLVTVVLVWFVAMVGAVVDACDADPHADDDGGDDVL